MQDLAVGGRGPDSDPEDGCGGGEGRGPEGAGGALRGVEHLHDESSEDSEFSGSWRTVSEETEEWKSEQWRSTVDLESEELGSSEGSDPEVEKEMDEEIVEEDMTLQ